MGDLAGATVAGRSSWDVVVPQPTPDEVGAIVALMEADVVVGIMYVCEGGVTVLFRWRGRYGMSPCPFCPRYITNAGAGRTRHTDTHRPERVEGMRKAMTNMEPIPTRTVEDINLALAHFGLGPIKEEG